MVSIVIGFSFFFFTDNLQESEIAIGEGNLFACKLSAISREDQIVAVSRLYEQSYPLSKIGKGLLTDRNLTFFCRCLHVSRTTFDFTKIASGRLKSRHVVKQDVRCCTRFLTSPKSAISLGCLSVELLEG